MSNLARGLIGAFAGGVEGYAGGKMNESIDIQKQNMLLIKDIMDRKNTEFEHRLGLKRVGVENEYALGRMELGNKYDTQNREDEQRFMAEQGKTDFERQFSLEKYRQSQQNARSRGGAAGASYKDYINPETMETMQIPEGGEIPKGFLPASQAASLSNTKINVKDYTGIAEINKGAILAKYGFVPLGDGSGMVSPIEGRKPMNRDEWVSFQSDAERLGLDVSGAGNEEDGYLPTHVVPRPILGRAANTGSTKPEQPDPTTEPKEKPKFSDVVKFPEQKPAKDPGRSYADVVGSDKNPVIKAEINGETMDIPLIVPTMTEAELNIIKSGEPPTQEMVEKAKRYAEEKVSAGKNPLNAGNESPIQGLIDRYRRNVKDPEVLKKLRGDDRKNSLRESFVRTPPKQ